MENNATDGPNRSFDALRGSFLWSKLVFDDNILVTFTLSRYVVSITVMLFGVHIFTVITLSLIRFLYFFLGL